MSRKISDPVFYKRNTGNLANRATTLGRFLLLCRFEALLAEEGLGLLRCVEADHLNTACFSDLTQPIKDGYGPGLDRVEMIMKLTVCP
jgi:hypothetical protein